MSKEKEVILLNNKTLMVYFDNGRISCTEDGTIKDVYIDADDDEEYDLIELELSVIRKFDIDEHLSFHKMTAQDLKDEYEIDAKDIGYWYDKGEGMLYQMPNVNYRTRAINRKKHTNKTLGYE
jgi:hypothetical protein